MDALSGSASGEFRFDLNGRVRNLGLPANQHNALVPLFEAVSNAIHAIEARWGEKTAQKGKIQITIHRRNESPEGNVTGFTVSDNGIGLNRENWLSFCTSDSEHKMSRGGKGVGRLVWLKVFDQCRAVSRFADDERFVERSFTFCLGSGNPITEHVLKNSSTSSPGTEIKLENYKTPYEVSCPKKSSTIAAKLVGHFLPYLFVGSAPVMVLVDGEESIDLRDFLHQNRIRYQKDDFELSINGGLQKFCLHSALIGKKVRFFENGYHWLFFAGHDRVVRSDSIDGQLGLKYIGDDNESVYVGLITGTYLDGHVNQERTSFTFDNTLQECIHKGALIAVKSFLSTPIAKIRAAQRETTLRVIRSNPQFINFTKDIDNFIEKNLSLSKQSEEEVFVELSRQKLRVKRNLANRVSQIKTGSKNLSSEVFEIARALNDEKKGSLAEYVVRRKAILDIFDSSTAYSDPESRKYFREEIVHSIIVPLRTDSEGLSYDDHNLWILDDRLAFYTYFRSDKPISSYVDGAESNKEPDLAVVFDNALAFQRVGRDEPIVIVEFKRPGRNDFTGDSSPVTQVLEYVDLFRSGSAIKDRSGKVIRSITNATRFICYIVADFTDSLLRVLRSSIANNSTADGRGYYGVSVAHNALIEVIPYEKIVDDARIRNEAFFERLGLI